VAAYLDGITFDRMASILAARGLAVGQDTLRRALRRHGYGGEDANANNIEFWTTKLTAVLDQILAPSGEL
jgi:hypothetical protein